MSYGRQRSGLLVPHRFVTHGTHRIPLPENIHDRKMIACMAYDDNGKPFGDLLRVPRDLDIDMVDDSGKTLRHALHLRLMRKLEDSECPGDLRLPSRHQEFVQSQQRGQKPPILIEGVADDRG